MLEKVALLCYGLLSSLDAVKNENVNLEKKPFWITMSAPWLLFLHKQGKL